MTSLIIFILFLGILSATHGFNQRCATANVFGGRTAASLSFSPKQASLKRRMRTTNLHSSKDDNSTPLGEFLANFSDLNFLSKEKSVVRPKSRVVAKYDLPSLGIIADQTYELQSIYIQGGKISSTDDSDSEGRPVVEKVPLTSLDLQNIPSTQTGSTLFITLYNPMYHDNDTHGGRAVVVEPAEVGLVTMEDEVKDSVLVALPILSFWIGTCITFTNIYTQRNGGTFVDALFGR